MHASSTNALCNRTVCLSDHNATPSPTLLYVKRKKFVSTKKSMSRKCKATAVPNSPSPQSHARQDVPGRRRLRNYSDCGCLSVLTTIVVIWEILVVVVTMRSLLVHEMCHTLRFASTIGVGPVEWTLWTVEALL